MEPVTAILMVGGWGASDLEQALRQAHRAAAHDLLERLLATGAVGRAVLATDDPALAASLGGLPVTVDLDGSGEPFHFGRRLAGLIEACGARRVLYSGGGSAPLMSIDDWRAALTQLSDAARMVVSNNLHSCDWVGFTQADEVLPLVAGQASDNALAWVLHHEGGLPAESRAPTAATRFDLDTPVDLLVAQKHPGVGSHLAQLLAEWNWDGARLDALLQVMATDGASLMVAGRVSSIVWQALERATSCWVRVFAEERGMRASGRQDKGQVRSLLADYLGLVGPDGFFEALPALADGVLLDNRVILAARRLWPTAPDRYNSDLLRWEQVSEPFLREFTRAAAVAAVPVVMGGHSVVAGGLLALVEILQARRSSRE